jgi:hypothetical protein
MTNKARNTAGKFSAKSETPRKVRSVNLTENCWQWLARIAEEAGMSRNDYLEALAEATANPIMETVQAEIENTEKQPDIKLLPIMETVEADIKLHKQLEASDAIIRNRNQEIAALQSRLAGKDEIIAEAQEQIARLESEIASRPAQNSAPIAIGAEFPEIEAADLLNKLKGSRKKSKADLADIETILEILDK